MLKGQTTQDEDPAVYNQIGNMKILRLTVKPAQTATCDFHAC